jgi:hypothetical protein
VHFSAACVKTGPLPRCVAENAHGVRYWGNPALRGVPLETCSSSKAGRKPSVELNRPQESLCFVAETAPELLWTLARFSESRITAEFLPHFFAENLHGVRFWESPASRGASLETRSKTGDEFSLMPKCPQGSPRFAAENPHAGSLRIFMHFSESRDKTGLAPCFVGEPPHGAGF